MNDEIGLLLFAKAILHGQSLSKKNPLYVSDEAHFLSERWGCNTLGELREKIDSELKRLMP